MSADPITPVPPAPTGHRPAVTVLSGFSSRVVQAAALALMVADERLVLVGHDISRIREGVVRRTVRTATQTLEEETVELVHGCVSCTLREDVLPALARMARSRPGSDLLLALPPVVEPESLAVCAAEVAELVRFDSYVTVVDAERFLGDLASADDLRDRDLHAAADDHRAVADVVARQVEFADTVLVWAQPGADEPELARLGTLLHRLAPWAARVASGTTDVLDCAELSASLRRTGRHDPARPGVLGLALSGRPIAVRDAEERHGVVSVLFETRRPFHPGRLHAALDELTANALRIRGQLWIASQPDTAVAVECAGGGVGLGSLGPWLAALPVERWAETAIERRLAAELDWDPYYGDRRTVLAFVGLHLDDATIRGLLHDCLVSDAELAAGPDEWRRLADPFAGCFPIG